MKGTISTAAVRRIRDSVHGTIDLSALEDAVLAHPMVQRLRRVKQLAFLSYVFPCATHSRFEHSLGAVHLATTAWQRMAQNQQRLAGAAGQFADFAAREQKPADRGGDKTVHGLLAPTFDHIDEIFHSEHIFQALRLASLLHDVGHPPFSHSGERFLPTWRDFAAGITGEPAFIRDWVGSTIARLEKKGKDPGKTRVRHEAYSILMIHRILQQTYADNPALDGGLTSQDVCSIVTAEIEPAHDSPLRRMNVYRLCHELIAAELDIDRMDYLIRDSKECGVVYGIFDAARILDSLCTFFNPVDGSLHLAIQFAGLAAFEDYLRARQSMYLQVYFHKTGVACEASLQWIMRSLDGWRLPVDPESYARVDEHNIDRVLREAAEVQIGDKKDRERVTGELDDLILNRKLWKRVFELTGSSAASDPKSQEAKNLLAKVKSLIEKENIPCEQVSSGTSLTRLSPRMDDGPSRNDIRLIKRDSLRCPRVVPIEDHSRIVGEGEGVHIHRLYVPLGVGPSGEKWHRQVRDLLRRSDLSL